MSTNVATNLRAYYSIKIRVVSTAAYDSVRDYGDIDLRKARAVGQLLGQRYYRAAI
jgi:hypothetical protein